MKTYPECLPCFLRQAFEAAKTAGVDEITLKNIMDETRGVLPEISLDVSPPEIARTVYGIVGKYTGGKDIYRKIKEKSNAMAMELYPALRKRAEESDDALLSAIRLAVAGNVIDYGVPGSFDIEKEIEECMAKDFVVFDLDDLRREILGARNILYLLDNAGEIVFDRLLIETLEKDVVCAVRGKPVINDVTLRDAEQVGLDKVTRVISSGSDIPGTVPEICADEFRECYDNADIVISKGQGNFETLEDRDKPIFFIFKAKCPVVAEHVGCSEGDIILRSNRRRNHK